MVVCVRWFKQVQHLKRERFLVLSENSTHQTIFNSPGNMNFWFLLGPSCDEVAFAMEAADDGFCLKTSVLLKFCISETVTIP